MIDHDFEQEKHYHPENMKKEYNEDDVDNIETLNYDNNMSAYQNRYRKTLRGLIFHSFQRQKKRKHKIEYSKEEFLNRCMKSLKLRTLYIRWRHNNFRPDLRPTIDRINPLKGYLLNNIQFLTYGENVRKGNRELIVTKGKKIIQLSLGGEKIAVFNSLKEAGEKTGFNSSNICNALKGRLKTYKMYLWKYFETKEEVLIKLADEEEKERKITERMDRIEDQKFRWGEPKQNENN